MLDLYEEDGGDGGETSSDERAAEGACSASERRDGGTCWARENTVTTSANAT